jgi:hypothetical protein
MAVDDHRRYNTVCAAFFFLDATHEFFASYNKSATTGSEQQK